MTGARAPPERLSVAARVGRSRTRVQRRRIEAETVPPLPCTAVSGHGPRLRLSGCARAARLGTRRARDGDRRALLGEPGELGAYVRQLDVAGVFGDRDLEPRLAAGAERLIHDR